MLREVNPFYCVIFICLFGYFSQGGGKLERARDLFEQVLEGCPAKFAKCKRKCLIQFFCFVMPLA